MDRSAQNIDRSSECEIMNLMRLKFVFDVSPLEIIDNDNKLFEDEDFLAAAAAAAVAVGMPMNINQIKLVIHAVNHGIICQYWSLKSNSLSSSASSSCDDQHHRYHHHLRDDDDDEEMNMLICRSSVSSPKTRDSIILLDRGVFAATDDDYIMSQLRDVDLLYEIEWILNRQQLEEVKRCIVRRISESKPALLLLAKTKAARIRLDLSRIQKKYYANSDAADFAYDEDELHNITVAQHYAIHYPPAAPPTFYDDEDDMFKRSRNALNTALRSSEEALETKILVAEHYAIHYPPAAPPTIYDEDDMFKRSRNALNTALRSSKEALETKILEEEDLISSSSSSSCCSVCLNEFRVGVDEIKKMPCSHVFHSNCLENWLWERNTCPLCYYKLPTFSSRFLEQY